MKQIVFLLVFASSSLCAAYPSRDRQPQAQSWRDVEREIENTQTEVRLLEEKLNVQETIVDALREQLFDAKNVQKDLVKGSESILDGKIIAMEGTLKGVVTDIKTLQSHLNETAKSLSSIQKDMVHMQQAMKQLMGALKEDSPSAYRVKPGDSLDKIARHFGVSVQRIKEQNQLKGDRIVTGQALTIPSKS
jgi:LysM repeat protein